VAGAACTLSASAIALAVGGGAGAYASRHDASPGGPMARTARSTNPYPKSLHGSFAFYSGADVNIQALWQNILIPSFERAYPHVTVDYVFSEHGASDITTLDRVAQAVKDKQPSGYALLESATNAVELAARSKLFIPVTAKAIPNSANVPAAASQVVGGDAVPYRGSKVVLAYNSATVTNPPTTLDGLVSWIEAHPGKFAYCNPADGGSGAYFVENVLDSKMPASAVQTLAFNDDTALESDWKPGMSLLHQLNADVYGNGTYPTGNTQVLSLLGSGAVQMATVWSDQGTQALQDGQLPSTVKLVDISPAFPGSPVYLGVPKYTPPHQVTLVDAFLNFVLSVPQQAKIVKKVAGFPAIAVTLMTPTVKSEFTPLGEAESLPYSANIGSDMNKAWQEEVP